MIEINLLLLILINIVKKNNNNLSKKISILNLFIQVENFFF